MNSISFNLLTKLWPHEGFPGFEENRQNKCFFQYIYENGADQFRRVICEELAAVRKGIAVRLKNDAAQEAGQVLALFDSLAEQVKGAVRVSHFLRKWNAIPTKYEPSSAENERMFSPK